MVINIVKIKVDEIRKMKNKIPKSLKLSNMIKNTHNTTKHKPVASGMTLSGYKSVRNKELTRVDLPRPLSPTTMRVNSKPFFTDFR